MDTNTVQVIEDMGNKLDHYINTIASKVGVAADHFYPLFVRQQMISGFLGCFFVVIGIIFIIVFLNLFIKSIKSKEYDNAFGWGWISFISILITSLILCTVAIKVFNPEYYAFQDLISMVKMVK